MLIDEQIKKQVIERLYWDDRVNAADVRVTCTDRRVVLSGSVPSYQARQAAETAAWGVAGVKTVENQLSIDNPAEASPNTDEDLRIGIQNKLQWNPVIDAEEMEVNVTGGIATIEGCVDAYWKKVRAEELAYEVGGVSMVENKLAVVPSRDVVDQAIAQTIIAAFARNPELDPNAINVQVEDGVVTLTGRVPNRNAFVAAQNAAAYTLGVVDVDARLVIADDVSVLSE